MKDHEIEFDVTVTGPADMTDEQAEEAAADAAEAELLKRLGL